MQNFSVLFLSLEYFALLISSKVLKYEADKEKYISILMVKVLLLCNLLTFNILSYDFAYQRYRLIS